MTNLKQNLKKIEGPGFDFHMQSRGCTLSRSPTIEKKAVQHIQISMVVKPKSVQQSPQFHTVN